MAEETGQEYFLDPHETRVSGAGETRCPCVKRSPLRFFFIQYNKTFSLLSPKNGNIKLSICEIRRAVRRHPRVGLSGILPGVLHLFNIIYGKFYDANDTYTESIQYQI